MGLYNTIEDMQVKCFTVPANILIDTDNGFELHLNVSGGKLIGYGIGSEIPYASPLYNYGKDFAIIDYMAFYDDPRVIFIVDGRVSELVSTKSVTEQQLSRFNMFIDKHGERLNITSVEAIVNLVPDYVRLSDAYNKRIEEIRIERNIPNVYSPEFRTQMASIPLDELKMIFQKHEKVIDDAFDETLKMFYDKYYNRNDTAHLDDTGVGIVYASLKDDFYSELNKKIICRLFKEKEYSDEMFEKYLEWIEKNPAVDKNDVIDTFAKYSLLEDKA